MKYKIIACDLDGTLLNSKGELSAENSAAIEELSRRGVLFVPATGRSLYESVESVRTHPSVRYMICSGGAVIYDFKTGDRFEFSIDGELTKKIHLAMKECECLIIGHKCGYSLVDKSLMSDKSLDEYHFSPYFRNQVINCMHPIDNFDAEFISGEPSEMMTGCFKHPEDLKKCMDIIGDVSTLNCVCAVSGTIDIASKDAGKRNAVKFLIDKLGITEEELITAGDSGNDMEMIKMTANSVATANAINSVKSVAGHVGCSNDEHIVRYIINRFFK